jgi:predicted  nucleic acid-binding Zn-ribbon protein
MKLKIVLFLLATYISFDALSCWADDSGNALSDPAIQRGSITTIASPSSSPVQKSKKGKAQKPAKQGFMRKILAPVTDLQTQSLELQQQIVKLQAPIENLQPPMIKLQDRVSSVEHQLSGVQKDMDSIRDELRSTHSDISAVHTQISRLEKPIGALQAPVTKLYQPVADLAFPLKDLRRQLGDLKEEMTELKQPIAALNAPLSQLQNPLVDLRAPITNVHEELLDLKTQLKDLKAAANKTAAYMFFAIVLASCLIAVGTPLMALLIWNLRRPHHADLLDEKSAVKDEIKELNRAFAKPAANDGLTPKAH